MLDYPTTLLAEALVGRNGRVSGQQTVLVELWLSFIYGSYNGGMVVMLTEIMPVEVRTTGFSLAYSLQRGINITKKETLYLAENTS